MAPKVWNTNKKNSEAEAGVPPPHLHGPQGKRVQGNGTTTARTQHDGTGRSSQAHPRSTGWYRWSVIQKRSGFFTATWGKSSEAGPPVPGNYEGIFHFPERKNAVRKRDANGVYTTRAHKVRKCCVQQEGASCRFVDECVAEINYSPAASSDFN